MTSSKTRMFSEFVLIMAIMLEASSVADNYRSGTEALREGIKHTIYFNSAVAEEVARETVGQSVAVNLATTGGLSDRSDGQNPETGEDIEGLVRRYFGSDSEDAIRVMGCESQGDPSRIGDRQMAEWSYGLFQINRTWHDYPPETLLDAESNVRIAKGIFDRRGWKAWTCGRRLVLGENI